MGVDNWFVRLYWGLDGFTADKRSVKNKCLRLLKTPFPKQSKNRRKRTKGRMRIGCSDIRYQDFRLQEIFVTELFERIYAKAINRGRVCLDSSALEPIAWGSWGVENSSIISTISGTYSRLPRASLRSLFTLRT
ncbi:hypothetical protein M513_01965 [Trichuris suis]|uniref:Uncharacterized protein n=1 Tax=Trichuris suis TaxID=68888 RepID=A0A085MIN4_9BILA|nr:hypothetical protein M513_01965 [Trichuris suis]